MRSAGLVVLLLIGGCASAPAATQVAAGTPSVSAVATVPASPTTTAATSALPASAVPSARYESAAVAAGAVPWADLPYHSPVGQRPPTGAPPWCTAAQLSLAPSSGADGAADMYFFDFPLTARPGVRCSLQGYPVVHVSDADHTWSVTSVPSSDFAVTPGGVLDPSHPTTVEFRWVLTDADGYAINADTGRLTVRFDLPHGGGRLTTDLDMTWHKTSPGGPLRIGRIIAEPLSATPPAVYGGTYANGLSASVRLTSRTVRAGSVLTYQVWLSGPGSLDPCVGYREKLDEWKTGLIVATEDHELNCTTASVPTYGRLFTMKIRVPASVPPGTLLTPIWQTDAAGGYPQSAQTADSVTVTG
jgi:hypothetical protein